MCCSFVGSVYVKKNGVYSSAGAVKPGTRNQNRKKTNILNSSFSVFFKKKIVSIVSNRFSLHCILCKIFFCAINDGVEATPKTRIGKTVETQPGPQCHWCTFESLPYVYLTFSSFNGNTTTKGKILFIISLLSTSVPGMCSRGSSRLLIHALTRQCHSMWISV